MGLIDRFITSFRSADRGIGEPPGLVQNDDGTVDVIRPDGSRGRIGNGGGSSLVTQVTKVLTPAMIQGSSVTAIELAPAPGVGKAYIDATSIFIVGAGFTAYGAGFSTRLTLGGNPFGSVVFSVADVPQLTLALKGGSPGDIVGTWFGGIQQQSWSSPASDLNDAAYLFSTDAAAPTGGAGDITVVSAMTTITLP